MRHRVETAKLQSPTDIIIHTHTHTHTHKHTHTHTYIYKAVATLRMLTSSISQHSITTQNAESVLMLNVTFYFADYVGDLQTLRYLHEKWFNT